MRRAAEAGRRSEARERLSVGLSRSRVEARRDGEARYLEARLGVQSV